MKSSLTITFYLSYVLAQNDTTLPLYRGVQYYSEKGDRVYNGTNISSSAADGCLQIWPNARVPFVFGSLATGSYIQVFEASMKHIEKISCMRYLFNVFNNGEEDAVNPILGSIEVFYSEKYIFFYCFFLGFQQIRST